MEVQVFGQMTAAPGAATLALTIPAGYLIDTAKLATGTANNVSNLGYGSGGDVNVNARFPLVVGYKDADEVYVRDINLVSASLDAIFDITATAPMTWAINDYFTVFFRVPVAGWN